MPGTEYLRHITRLGLNQSEAGLLFGVAKGTGRRWVADGCPESVAMLLRIAERLEWPADYLRKVSKG